MLKFRYKTALVSVLLLAITTEVWGMGLFDSLKVCLFSEVSGVVMMAGKPVAGVEVIRTVEMNPSSEITQPNYTEKTVTDALGHFHFEAKFSQSLKKILPVQPRMRQFILFRHNGNEYLGWKMYKFNYDEGGEINSLSARESRKDIKPLRLKCDLSSEPKIKLTNSGDDASGLCEWE
jgi:hypothetical protein